MVEQNGHQFYTNLSVTYEVKSTTKRLNLVSSDSSQEVSSHTSPSLLYM